MNELILHHFDLSPFAEKVRLMFGIKQLAWRSVEIPMVMPKPGLTALTGGYRKTPVLQVGADIYCDTRLIASELEARHPVPSLFAAGNRGLSMALSAWSDRSFFEPGAGLAMGLNKRGLPDSLIADRKAFFNFMDFDHLEADIPHLTTQLMAHADWVEQQLSDGRPYLFGESPDLADVHGYFPVWMARAHIPTADVMFARLERLPAWEQRLRSIGHGQRSAMTAGEAHRVAREAVPLAGRGVDADDPLQLKSSDRVAVTAEDYGRDPVVGELSTLSLHEVAVRRADPVAGTVIVHFPRIGYRVTRA